jgi:hypothetical protein
VDNWAWRVPVSGGLSEVADTLDKGTPPKGGRGPRELRAGLPRCRSMGTMPLPERARQPRASLRRSSTYPSAVTASAGKATTACGNFAVPGGSTAFEPG